MLPLRQADGLAPGAAPRRRLRFPFALLSRSSTPFSTDAAGTGRIARTNTTAKISSGLSSGSPPRSKSRG